MSVEVRLATESDIDQLIRMRWDFTFEHYSSIDASYQEFHKECKAFFEQALFGNRWFIWLAEINGLAVSHIYIELIEKVPRPGRISYPFAYMTNVYTIPEYRSRGIGGQILKRINEWSREKQHEFIIVWPSDDAVTFYARNGYKHCKEPMELQLGD